MWFEPPAFCHSARLSLRLLCAFTPLRRVLILNSLLSPTKPIPERKSVYTDSFGGRAMLLVPDQIKIFLIAGGIGLLIGLERERVPSARAGLRTFALIGMLGALTALLGGPLQSPWPFVTGLAAVGVMIIAAYLSNPDPQDPGTTSVAALLLCYCLGGATALGYAQTAVMLGVATTGLLYFKAELRGIATRLKSQDWISILQFGVLSLVILPILPNEEFGPYRALNPYQVWWMVVLISGLGLAGYAALQLVGPKYGLAFVGLFGGLASSTATTMIYAKQARSTPAMAPAGALVILLANLVMVARVTIIATVVAPMVMTTLLSAILPTLALGLLALAWTWRRLGSGGELVLPETKNPAELKAALGFGLLYALVLLCAAWLSAEIGNRGLYVLALVSGATDVDAINLSTMRLLTLGQVQLHPAVVAVLLAVCANLSFKTAMSFAIGGREIGLRILPGMLAVGLGLGGGMAWLLFATP